MSADRPGHDDKTPPAAADQGDGKARQDTGRPGGPGEAHGQRQAETRTREEYAEAIRAGTAAGPGRESPDNRAVPKDHSRGHADQAADPARGQQADSRRPETVTFENKDIEVTRKAADGVWVEGLPGEPPTRIGDLLSSSEDPERSRADKLRSELNKEAEGITDTGGKVADLIQEILDNPQPTHSMTHSRGPDMAAAGTEHGISAGHGVEAMLTLSIVGAAAVHKIVEKWRNAQDR
ncbi:MAG: hypothetical protein ABSB59_40705 [Streptosporangiaceae bacterium]|jgi:hypothetical protein